MSANKVLGIFGPKQRKEQELEKKEAYIRIIIS